MQKHKNILICPLDWGIGHATRCVPIVNELIKNGHKPIIAADNRPLEFLKKEFPDLQFIRFGGYDIKYPKNGSMVWKMFCSIPKIIRGIKREHREVKKIIIDHKIDVLISDNRYGLWNKDVRTVFITHQLKVKMPYLIKILEPIISFFIRRQIEKFNECWIPDFESGETLSGDLSHRYPIKVEVHFIGPLSRFLDCEILYNEIRDYFDLFVILSGPEPQRSIFEGKILEQLKESSLKGIVVQGITEKDENFDLNENIKVYSHLPTDEMLKYFRMSKTIICRPGYSSIMDIVTLGKKAIFIPTPGQTEQEYLADYFMKKNIFYSVKQNRFSIEEAMKKSASFNPKKTLPDSSLLVDRIIDL